MNNKGFFEPSLTELEHHPECPHCVHTASVGKALTTVEGLRAARVRDDLIEKILRDDGYSEIVIEDAMMGDAAWE